MLPSFYTSTKSLLAKTICVYIAGILLPNFRILNRFKKIFYKKNNNKLNISRIFWLYTLNETKYTFRPFRFPVNNVTRLLDCYDKVFSQSLNVKSLDKFERYKPNISKYFYGRRVPKKPQFRKTGLFY